MNYATIKNCDIANGPGVRVSLFVSGCEHYCKECFNPEAWNFYYGNEYTKDTNDELFEALDKDYIRGLTILGGEPMHPKNQEQVLQIVKEFNSRYKFSTKDIWLYTGYYFEDLYLDKVGTYSNEILKNVNVVVDGPFESELKDIGLNFRGSSNQRIIDVDKTIEVGEIIIHPLGLGDSNKYNKKENLNE
jgi:anaerobic ribonucleoside-triphosphate reductase activating protein